MLPGAEPRASWLRYNREYRDWRGEMKPEKRIPTLVQDPPALDEDDLREPTKEEILEDLRIGLRDAIAGLEGRPATEVLDEIDRELAEDANTS